jgi:hypothetical protein
MTRSRTSPSRSRRPSRARNDKQKGAARIRAASKESAESVDEDSTLSQVIDRWLDFIKVRRGGKTYLSYLSFMKRVKADLGHLPITMFEKKGGQLLDKQYEHWLDQGLPPATEGKEALDPDACPVTDMLIPSAAPTRNSPLTQTGPKMGQWILCSIEPFCDASAITSTVPA